MMELVDNSKVRGLIRKTKIYDDKGGVEFKKVRELQNKTSNRYEVNEYDGDENHYTTILPIISFGSNFDDGFFFGGGITATVPGFRGVPFKASHAVSASFAPSTNAFTLNYALDRKGTFHRLGADFIFNATLQNPFYVNYYGRGNETPFFRDTTREYYFVRLIDYQLSTGIKKTWLSNRYQLKIGPAFESVKVDVINGRVSEEPAIGLTNEDKERKNFLGGFFEAAINTVKKEGARDIDGVAINFRSNYFNQTKSNNHYADFNGDISYYISFFKKLQTTFATRIGAGVNVGEIPFYRANTLGGTTHIRGFRRDRFTGKYMFYQNLDLRVKLFYWQNKVLPFEFGIHGGFDYGRVWEPNEQSNKLHLGYAAGVWLTPFKTATITFNYNISEEEKLFSFGFGFLF